MTLEPKGGHVTRIPAWVYWTFVSLTAGLPIVIGSDIIPAGWRVAAMAINASLAVLTGASSPTPPKEK